LRAAVASPPEENIQLPNCVFTKSQVPTAVRPSHHTTAIGMPGASGMPSLRMVIQPSAPIHWNTGLKT
jgi:hypothetical protein